MVCCHSTWQDDCFARTNDCFGRTGCAAKNSLRSSSLFLEQRASTQTSLIDAGESHERRTEHADVIKRVFPQHSNDPGYDTLRSTWRSALLFGCISCRASLAHYMHPANTRTRCLVFRSQYLLPNSRHMHVPHAQARSFWCFRKLSCTSVQHFASFALALL